LALFILGLYIVAHTDSVEQLMFVDAVFFA